MLLMERFNPVTVARVIERDRATRFFGVPAMYARMLATPHARAYKLESLRACRSGAAPLPVAVKEAFDDLVGHEALIEAFGLTEGGPLTHANPTRKARAGSIGIPLPDTDARIVDPQGHPVTSGMDGELLVRGPQVMRGYWRNPRATAEALNDGWLRTGDIARMDKEGYFWIVDRLKDSLNCGGFKVWPREVEEVLYRHPAIQMAAVIGEPDVLMGEVVKAFVVVHALDRPNVTAEAVRDHCRRELAPYKVPRMVDFVDCLPMSSQGKVLRRMLRAA